MLLSRSPGGATVAPVLPPAAAAKLKRYCRKCRFQCRPAAAATAVPRLVVMAACC